MVYQNINWTYAILYFKEFFIKELNYINCDQASNRISDYKWTLITKTDFTKEISYPDPCWTPCDNDDNIKKNVLGLFDS